MKIYFLKREGKNWIANFPLCLTAKVGLGKRKFYADYHFYKKKDAEEYRKRYKSKYGNPFVVWSAEVKEDKRDNRKNL